MKYQRYSHIFLDEDASTSQAEADILGGFLLVFFFTIPLILSVLLKIAWPAWHGSLLLLEKSQARIRGTFKKQPPTAGCSRMSLSIHPYASPGSSASLLHVSEMLCTPPRLRGPHTRDPTAGTPLAHLTTGSGMASALAGTWTPFSHSCLQGSAST